MLFFIIGDASKRSPLPPGEGQACPEPSLSHPLDQAPGDVLVQQARNERLIRQPLFQRPFLEGFEVLGGDPDVHAAVLLEGCRGVPLIPVSVALKGWYRFSFSPLDRCEEILFLSIQLSHRLSPFADTSLLPCDLG